METDIKTSPDKAERRYQRHRNSRIAGGIILLTVGGVLAARQAGVQFPEWFFTWQMIVILSGVYIGIKERFREWGWLIVVAIGVVFLGDRFIEGFTLRTYMWPIIVIAVGLFMMASPRSKKCW